MMDLPFICLDTEADVQHTITIMDNITVGAVFSTVGEFNSLGKCLSAGESCVIKDPSRLYQLDLWDTTLCLWPTGNIYFIINPISHNHKNTLVLI